MIVINAGRAIGSTTDQNVRNVPGTLSQVEGLRAWWFYLESGYEPATQGGSGATEVAIAIGRARRTWYRGVGLGMRQHNRGRRRPEKCHDDFSNVQLG